MIAIKVYRDPSENPRVYKIAHFPVVIGRSVNCDICIDHVTVSAEHAVIGKTRKGYYIKDTGSSNGIFVGGKKRSKCKLDRNTEVTIGLARLEIIFEEERLEDTEIVELAIEKTGVANTLEKVKKGMPHVILLLVFFGCFSLNPVMNYHRKDSQILSVVSSALMFLMAAAMMTLVISIYSKISQNHYNYLRLFRWVMVSLIAVVLYSLFETSISINIPMKILRSIVLTATVLTCSFVVLYRISLILFPEEVPRKVRRYIGGIILGCFLIFRGFGEIAWHYDSVKFSFDSSIGYPIIPFSKSYFTIEKLMKKVDESENMLRSYAEKDR